RLIGDAHDRNRLPVVRIALPRLVVSVVFVVEQVVRLEDAVERSVTTKTKPLLQPEIDTVDRGADKVIPRHDGAVRTQPVAALTAWAQVAAVARGEALPGAVEIQPAQLETAADLPDPVERGPVALVGRRE